MLAMMVREHVSRLLPAALKRWLRPRLMPLLYWPEQRRMRRLYRSMIGAGDLVFDIGAAEGYHAEVFLSLGARVVCVEPQPELVAVLENRFATHPQVTVVASGVGEVTEERTLHLCPGDPEIATFALEKWSQGRYAGRRWSQTVTVPVVTLDSLVDRFGCPRFVKIDVEGFEPQVLGGLSVPLPALSFEFTGEHLDDLRGCVQRVLALAPARFNLSLGRRFQLLSRSWLGGEDLVAMVTALPPRRRYGDIYVKTATP
jgi:FkbM family methyltransferase